MNSTHLAFLLDLFSGLAWTIVYFQAIRVGLRDKSYAMPLAALGLNIAWEGIYAVRSLSDGVSAQGIINLIWCLFDVGIVYTYLKYGRRELHAFVSRPMFLGWFAAVMLASFAVQGLFLVEFGDLAPLYSAFLQNLLMSGLFIAMLISRRGLRGQNMTIAVAKWLGTLAPTISIGLLKGYSFALWVGLLCSIFDLMYIALIRRLEKNPNLFQVERQAPAEFARPPAS
ncbi:hypothetical protein Dxin01_02676 [Deinococcus xinjiangensis]|uniref:Uncharacterized protein n=1 Tax=Deinococcus xinjiangensis TaxID=457454 RepID=A0ABP9VCG2_9DEIO